MWGSSPLARGLLNVPVVPLQVYRIIPARAGFTPWMIRGFCRRSDHPRSRGVYTYFHNLGFDGIGSSPLARGLRRTGLQLLDQTRIIPARAGFTRILVLRRGRLPDHPRSRGVYVSTSTRCTTMSGSSPLARGLQNLRFSPGPLKGIIPARAGFTRTPTSQGSAR